MNRKTFLVSAAVAGAALGRKGDAAPLAQANGLPVGGSAPLPSASLSIDGEWAFRVLPNMPILGASTIFPLSLLTQPATAGRDSWTAAQVPGCWERDGRPQDLMGPVLYRRDVHLPPGWAPEPGRKRLWWELDAVSYHAIGWGNGHELGTHTGLWDAFAWEVPQQAITNGDRLALALQCEKPGAESFPLRETLAGFLPEVWGTWGGPWQGTRLRVTGPIALRSLFASGRANGTVTAEVEVDLPTALPGKTWLQAELTGPDGRVVARQQAPLEQGGIVRLDLAVPGLTDSQRWSPGNPALFGLTVTALVDGRASDRRSRTVGFRDITVDEERILLNGRPLYLRMPLSWGWYPEPRAPAPPAKMFELELQRARALGFNGIKLCQWVPPQSYFEIADRLGMLLWVELPMWHPQDSDLFRTQSSVEYSRILRQIGDHSSAIAWTAGAVSSTDLVDPALLAGLCRQTEAQTRSPLVRSSADFSEDSDTLPASFQELQVRSDLPYTRSLLSAFRPTFEERRPFLLGEYGEAEAVRDLPALMAAQGGGLPWWAATDKAGRNGWLARLESAELRSRLPELRASAQQRALAVRKTVLELARSQPHIGGYVVSALRDTPRTTSGLLDDLDAARFTPAEFTSFNVDTVLFLEPGPQRERIAGGERTAFPDRYCFRGGKPIQGRIGVSHYGPESGGGLLRWRVVGPDGKAGQENLLSNPSLKPGNVVALGSLTFDAPAVVQPSRLSLAAELSLPGRKDPVTNRWNFWVFPEATGAVTSGRVGLYDPEQHLQGFAEGVGIEPVLLTAGTGRPVDRLGDVATLVATAWRPEMLDYVRQGGQLLLVQPGASAPLTGAGLPAVALPFWREALLLNESGHPSWGDFPREGATSMLLYGLASDTAFEEEEVRRTLGPEVRLAPVLSRVDARSLAVHRYIMAGEVGRGRMLLTTLRPQGGLGDQPSGLAYNVAGAYLLRTWLGWLGAAR